jgi:uncharacterized protein
MAVDHIRYDLLAQEALRGVVRRVLSDVARKGMAGEHHFFITFSTPEPGVKLSARMRDQYPEEMTIVLQHQFWDLKVTDDHFEVGLSFGGIPETLVIPFAAIKSFFDPSVQFGLQFETIGEGGEQTAAPRIEKLDEKPAAKSAARPAAKPRQPVRPKSGTDRPPPPAVPEPAEPQPAAKPDDAASTPGAEVVQLDRFRKK